MRILGSISALLLSVSLSSEVFVVPEQINTNTTLTGLNSIGGTVTVASNAVLRFSPGAQIMLGTDATLVVRGQILAEGTSNAPILFTRLSSTERWKGIRLIQAQPSRFVHCTFEYANSAGSHLDYYDDDCNDATAPPTRNYHEAIVALATEVTFEDCLFQKLPNDAGGEGDAMAIISDDPQFPGRATAHINRCRFISIGQGIHSRFSYILVENSFFTDHHGDNDDIDMYGESVPVPMIRNNVFLNPAHDDMINPTRCSAIIMGNVISGGDDHGIVLRDKCSPMVVNNFISNIANGGISVQNQCDALIANNTIVNCGRGIRLFDHIDRRSAPYCLFPGSGRATIVNTIIWDCAESLTLTDSPYTGDRGSHVMISYSTVEGGQASATVSASSTLNWGAGMRTVDPQLNNDLRLPPASPLIDAGTFMESIRPFVRILDGNGDGAAAPDIGADEFLLASADSNQDGIPDGWTDFYGMDPSATNVASGNPDGDAHTTGQEWAADTDPRDGGSYLRVENFRDAGIEFLTSSNRLYTVQYSTNLLSPTWIEIPNASNTPGTGALVRHPAPLTERAAYFRVKAELPE